MAKPICAWIAGIYAASFVTRRVAVNTLSGEPVMRNMPTIRGDMLVGDVKQVYMLGVGKVDPRDVKIVPAVPAGFASAAPMDDHQPVGLHGEEVHCIALSRCNEESCG